MRNIVLNILLFFLLSASGLALSVFFYQDAYPTTYLAYHTQDASSAGLVTRGSDIRGKFEAQGNNLASVKLRVQTYNRLNTTHITFRLRQQGKDNWLVTNTYAVDRFSDGLLYPFGFPPVFDSERKQYEYVVSSDDGVSDNAIGISGSYHSLATQYLFQKSQLLLDRTVLKIFIREKLLSLITDPYYLLYSVIFLIPAIVFVLGKAQLMKKQRIILSVAFMSYVGLVYTYVPLNVHSNILVYILLVGLLADYWSKTENAFFYILALVSILQIPFLISFGNIFSANRAATLVFVFLLSGVIMSIRELNKKVL